MVANTFNVPFLDFSNTMISHSLQSRLFLQFHSSHISRHLEYLSFVLTQSKRYLSFREDIVSFLRFLRETVLILNQNVSKVDWFPELSLFIIGLLLIISIKISSHWRKTIAVDLILPHFSYISFFLNKVKFTYPVCSFGGLVIVLREILCLTEIN